MSHRHPSAQQFPPGVYDLTAGSGEVFRVLSLSSTVPVTSPAFAWQPNREHWFSPVGTKLTSALAASSMDVVYTSDLSSIQKVADDLANPLLNTFQLYALGILDKSDWTLGVPSWASPAYYFESSTTPKMLPLFEVSSSNPFMLTHINWFSSTNTLTSYFQGASPGAKINIAAKPLSNIPTKDYYYRAP